MTWAFLAFATELRRRAIIALVALGLAVTALAFGAAAYLGATDDPCAPAFIDEVQEIRLIDHPECRDGGQP